MEVVLFTLGVTAFLLSMIGCMTFLDRKFRINPAFLPLIVSSAIAAAVFLGGLIGLLLPFSIAVLAAGWGLLVFFIIQAVRKKYAFEFLKNPGIVFFLAASLLMIPVLYGAHYYHYDNFSHWGTVLSEMQYFNSFPDARSIVNFRAYPPGTASFLYAFCKIAGQTEYSALLGQTVLCLSALSALFASVKKLLSWRFFATAFLSAALFSMLVYDDGTLHIYSLLVDALIAFVFLGGYMIITAERQNPVRCAFMLTPVTVFLVIIKANAVIFAAVLWIALIVIAIKDKSVGAGQKLIGIAAVLGSAGLYWIGWRIYRGIAYESVDFNLNLPKSLAGEAARRGSEYYSTLFSRLWEKLIDTGKIYTVLIIVLFALVLFSVFAFSGTRKTLKKCLLSMLLSLGIIVGYIGVLVFLYCFIIPAGEGIVLASFERYIMTPVIAACGISAIAFFDCAEASEKAAVTSGAATLRRIWALLPAVIMCVITFGQAKQLVVRPDFDSTQRGEVYAALTAGQRVIPRGSNTIMYNGARDRVDLYYYLMYYQLSSRGNYVVDMHYPDRIEQLGFLENYDYIIIAVNDGYIYQKLGEYNIEKKEGCCVYRIEKNESLVTAIVPAE